MASKLEVKFYEWLGQNPDIPEPEVEYRFHPHRQWRFDFAWPAQMFAVEIEGGLYKGGRHQSLKGFIADCEKYEEAMILGWTVYRVPGPWVADGERRIWREETMQAIRTMLRAASEEQAVSLPVEPPRQGMLWAIDKDRGVGVIREIDGEAFNFEKEEETVTINGEEYNLWVAKPKVDEDVEPPEGITSFFKTPGFAVREVDDDESAGPQEREGLQAGADESAHEQDGADTRSREGQGAAHEEQRGIRTEEGSEGEEYCPAREEGIHCVHWWDAEKCCSCFAGATCIEGHSCSTGCETEEERTVSCCYTGACDCCGKVVLDGEEGMNCECAADDCACIHGYAAENYD